MSLSKTEIARRQLGAALALFLDDNDSVAVHVLACGGGEVAEHLSVRAGKQPFSTQILGQFPDMDRSRLNRIRNKYWNAFKHATTRKGLDRQDEEVIQQFDDGVNDHVLYLGWHDYMLATTSLPIEAQVFQMWYFALYPQNRPLLLGVEL